MILQFKERVKRKFEVFSPRWSVIKPFRCSSVWRVVRQKGSVGVLRIVLSRLHHLGGWD